MADYPRISTVGLSGFVVTFAVIMEPRANLAAIAFRTAVEHAGWDGVVETSSTLVSCYIGADLSTIDAGAMRDQINDLLTSRDWFDAAPPPGRKLWTIPMCFGGHRAPQLAEAAKLAGLSEADAAAQLAAAQTRVITVGYAPGQPYLGMLPEAWNIPRQADLTPQVPAGALVVAIRQFVLFTAAMPTGWRHVGQTAFRTFDPDRAVPIPLTPGDEMRFAPITETELADLEATDSMGGATKEALP